MLRAVVFLVVVMVIPLEVAASDDPYPERPMAAFALGVDDGVIVAWLPGSTVADRYNVYGLQDGQRSLLESVANATHTIVSPGYVAYEVTAMTGDAESAPTRASQDAGPCINIDQGPPPRVAVGCMGRIEIQPGSVPTPLALA